MTPTLALINAAAFDAGNRSCFGPDLRGAGMPGSKPWSQDDYNVACREHARLMYAVGFRLPNEYARKIRKLSEARRRIPQSRPVSSRDFVKVR